MSSSLSLLSALVLAALAILLPSSHGAYLALYTISPDPTQQCAAPYLYASEAVPVNLLTAIPSGYNAVFRQPVNVSNYQEGGLGPYEVLGSFNSTSLSQCLPIAGTTTQFNYSLFVWFAQYAAAIDGIIGATTPAVPQSIVSTLIASVPLSEYVHTTGPANTCLPVLQCFGFNATLYGGGPTFAGPYGQFCANAQIQFSCAAEVAPPVVRTGAFGDPQLYGLLGQSYQVHGIDGAIYALISAPSLQVNARFDFLASAACPPTSVVNTPCWSHPGSYMGAIGVSVELDGVTMRFSFESGPASLGFSSIQQDGQQLTAGAIDASYLSGRVILISRSTHSVQLRTPLFTFDVDSSDSFVNLRLTRNVALSVLQQQRVHGLLGQTHTRRDNKAGAVKDIEGEVDDYVAGETLHSTSFVYNRYGVKEE